MKLTALAKAFLLLGLTVSEYSTAHAAAAQEKDSGTTAGNPRLKDTGISGVRVYEKMPSSFSINTASEKELNAYGIPSRPDRYRSPEEYNKWIHLFSRNRVFASLKENTKVVHPIGDILTQTRVGMKAVNSTSNNWSGYVITDTTNPFKTVGTRISAVFLQPVAQTGCEHGSGDYHSSFWVGIDGWQSNDVLQVGTEMDYNCHTYGNNYGWIEWYDTVNQHPEIQITNMPVSPGFEIDAEVWLQNTGTYELYFGVNNTYTLLSLTPPPGVTLKGNSIEWIAERPGVNGSLSTLSSFGLLPWFSVSETCTGCAVFKTKPSTLASTSTLWSVNMTDATGKVLSQPYPYAGNWPTTWDDAIVFSAAAEF